MSAASPPTSTCCSTADAPEAPPLLQPVVDPSSHPDWGSSITTRWNEEGGMYWIEEEMKSKLSLVPLTDQETLDLIALLGRRLLEMDVHQLERAVYRLGKEKCRQLLAVTEEKIKNNAPEDALYLYTQDGSKRARTPGGVFWKIIKTSEDIESQDKSFIFRGNTTRQNKIRRDKARIDLIFANLSCFAPSDPRVRAIRDIVAALGMTETTIAERLIEKKGVDFARSLLAESLELCSDASNERSAVEARILRKKTHTETVDGEEVEVKRTPGGVFAQLIKADENISAEDKLYIFALARGGKGTAPRRGQGRGRPPMFTKQYQDATWRTCGGVGTPGRFVGDMDYEERGEALPSAIPPPEGNMAGFMILPEDAPERIVVLELAAGLGVNMSLIHVHFLERLVVRKGIAVAVELYEATKRIEKECGGRLGGVVTRLIKEDDRFTEEDVAFIYKVVPSPETNGNDDSSPMKQVINTAEESARFKRLLAEMEVMNRICVGLKIHDQLMVERMIHRKGLGFASALYEAVTKIENNGGMMSDDGTRKRTPAAIFIKIFKEQASTEDIEFVLSDSMSWWKKPLDLGVNAAAMTSDHDDDDQFNTEVARTLAEGILLELERLRLPASDWIIVERAVERVGASVCRRMLSRTKRFFERDFRANGGSTSAHIETPGRVWAGLLLHKVGVSREDLNYIFGVATLSQRRLISDAAGTAGTKGCLVVPDVVEPPSKSHQQIAKALTLGLSMLTITANDLEVTGRVVERLGTDVARDMLALTQQVEEEGGEMSRDGTRRKTPLNVFLSLLKFKRDRFGVTDEDLRYIFENPKRLRRDTIREDMHYAPSLFTPIRPFSQLEKSGRDRDTIDFIKSFLVPALPCLEYIPIQDPRLDTVIAGTVFLGPAKMSMVERAVYTFGSDWVHETLQKINDDMMAAEDSKFSCTTAFKNSIKEYGTMAQYDFVVAQACEAHVSRDEVEEPVQLKRVTLAPRPNAVGRGLYGKGKCRGKGKSGKGKGKGKGDAGKGWRRGHSSWRQHDPYEEDRYVPVLGRKRESPERVDEDGFVTVKQRRGGKRTSENEAVELRPALAVTKYTDHLATDHHDPAQPSPTTRE